MNAAEVDFSEGKSMVSVLRPPGQAVGKTFEVRHTGRYYGPTAQYLCEAGIFVSAVNPKLIKDYGNNSLRKVKTDKADSWKIAKYALDNWTELRQYTSMDKIPIGNGLNRFYRSRRFPPVCTVHDSFPSHGAPSIIRLQ